MESSTVELKRMYVEGSENAFGYSSSYLTPFALVASGVGM